jgi:hypothetical protein
MHGETNIKTINSCSDKQKLSGIFMFITRYPSTPGTLAWSKKIDGYLEIFETLTQPAMSMERKESGFIHPLDLGPLPHSSLHILLSTNR